MSSRTQAILIFAGCLSSIAAMGSAFHDWAELFRPGFIFGCIGVIGTHITAALSKAPSSE